MARMEHVKGTSNINHTRVWLWRLSASSEETDDMRGGQEVTLSIDTPRLVLRLPDISHCQVLGDVFFLSFSITVVATGGRERQRERQRERGRERQRERQRERGRERQRQREAETERQRETEREMSWRRKLGQVT
jgi:hypothetical protein